MSSRIVQIEPRRVEFIPGELEEGVLYISERFHTAAHRCCCGCGAKIVTPLKPFAWTLTEAASGVTLRPSVGSWNLACKSHYWITKNAVEWDEVFSEAEIESVRKSDEIAREQHFARRARSPFWQRWNQAWRRIWERK